MGSVCFGLIGEGGLEGVELFRQVTISLSCILRNMLLVGVCIE